MSYPVLFVPRPRGSNEPKEDGTQSMSNTRRRPDSTNPGISSDKQRPRHASNTSIVSKTKHRNARSWIDRWKINTWQFTGHRSCHNGCPLGNTVLPYNFTFKSAMPFCCCRKIVKYTDTDICLYVYIYLGYVYSNKSYTSEIFFEV